MLYFNMKCETEPGLGFKDGQEIGFLTAAPLAPARLCKMGSPPIPGIALHLHFPMQQSRIGEGGEQRLLKYPCPKRRIIHQRIGEWFRVRQFFGAILHLIENATIVLNF
jgi:hypothetical protein